MTGVQWVWLVAFVVAMTWPFARWITRTLRAVPRGKRLAVAGAMLKGATSRQKTNQVPDDASETVAALYRAAPELRQIPLTGWHELGTLVNEVRAVAGPEVGVYGASLDVDGSVLVTTRHEDGGYVVSVVGPDGSTTGIVEEREGIVLDASIDHGRCAWWHVTPELNRADLRMWDPSTGFMSLGHLRYELSSIQDEPVGWVVLAGDTAVGTLLGEPRGVVVAGRPGQPLTRLGGTRFVTVARDAAAEKRGLQQVAATLHGPETDDSDQLTSFDVSAFPPRPGAVRRAMIPGASVADGQPVGLWPRPRLLELPGALGVPLAPDAYMAGDPRSDGEFVAFLRFDAGQRGTPKGKPVVLHMPTGAMCTLGSSGSARMEIRGGRVMWSELVSDKPFRAVTYVGELHRPGTA